MEVLNTKSVEKEYILRQLKSIVTTCIKNKPLEEEVLKEIIRINKDIISSSSLEVYFRSPEEVYYYSETFSKQVITSILSQQIFYSEDKNSLNLKALTSFLNIMVKFLAISDHNNFFDAVMDIFDHTHQFYKCNGKNTLDSASIDTILTADQFNRRFPRLCRETNFNLGDEIDVLSCNGDENNKLTSQLFWTRGIVVMENREAIRIATAEKASLTRYSRDSIEIAPKGTMTKDYEWRINLKEGDTVDCFCEGKVFPCTVVKVDRKVVNDLPYVEFRIGFRIYLEKCPDYEKYMEIWPGSKVRKCYQTRKEYIGLPNIFDRLIPYFSNRIMPFGTYSCSDFDRLAEEQIIPYSTVKYENEDGSKNFVIGRNIDFSYNYTSIVENVANQGLFSKMTSMILDKGNLNGNEVYYILLILSKSKHTLHNKFLEEVSSNITFKIPDYLLNLLKDLGTMKIQAISTLIDLISSFMKHVYNSKKKEEELFQFELKFANKFIKSTIPSQIAEGIDHLVETIDKFRLEKDKIAIIYANIKDNGILTHIFEKVENPKTIRNSEKMLKILLTIGKLNCEEMVSILNLARKRSLEQRKVIFEILTEISKFMEEDLLSSFYKQIIQDSNQIIEEDVKLLNYLFLCLTRFKTDIEKSYIAFLKRALYKLESTSDPMANFILGYLVDKLFVKRESGFRVFQSVVADLKTTAQTEFCYFIFAYGLTRKTELSIDFLFEIDIHSEFFAELETYLKKAKKDRENNKTSLTQHFKALSQRIKFLIQLDKHFNAENLTPLKNTLFSHKVTENDPNFLYKYIFSRLRDKSSRAPDLLAFFIECLKEKKDIQSLSLKGFNCFKILFLLSNEQNNKLITTKTPYLVNKELLVKFNELDGFKAIFEIITESFSFEIFELGFGLIEELTNSKADLEEVKRKLLRFCAFPLEKVGEFDILDEEKTQRIKKSLKMLSMLNAEAKKDMPYIKSHSSILRQKVIKLTINTRNGEFSDVSVRVYSNTTLWELKRIVAGKFKICVDFLQILRKKSRLEPKDDCKMLSELEFEDGKVFEARLMKSDNFIPRVPLVKDGKVISELVSVFEGWYCRYNKQIKGKMTRKECAEFIKDALGLKGELKESDERVERLFYLCETDEEGFLTQDGFVSYFIGETKNPRKRNVIWANLKAMGVRNDLKSVNDSYEFDSNHQKEALGYFLSHDSHLFISVFNLKKTEGEIGEMAFDLINAVPTSPTIYSEVIAAFEEENKLDSIFDRRDPSKMFYCLQIILSLIEELVDVDETVECLNHYSYGTTEKKDICGRKSILIEKFIENDGFDKTISLLVEQLETINLKDSKLREFDRKYIEYLLRIVKTLFYAALSKKLEFDFQSDILETEPHNTFRQSSTILTEKTSDKILDNPNLPAFTENLIQVAASLLKEGKEQNIVIRAFSLVNAMIAFNSSEEFLAIEKISLPYTEVINKGLLSFRFEIQDSFLTILTRLIKQVKVKDKQSVFKVPTRIILDSYLNTSKEGNTAIFALINILIEDFYLLNPDQEITKQIKSFVDQIASKVEAILSKDSAASLKSPLLVQYLSIITKTSSIDPKFRATLLKSSSIFYRILDKILFVPTKSDEDPSDNFYSPKEIMEDEARESFSNDLAFASYALLISLLQLDIKIENKPLLTHIADKGELGSSNAKKVHGYVGLRNIGCISYMNSVLQQLFMIPNFATFLLSLENEEPPQCDNEKRRDDNLLHQLQRMFSYLLCSNKRDFNPRDFCCTLKNSRGNPINTAFEADACGFLSTLLSRFGFKLVQEICLIDYLSESIFDCSCKTTEKSYIFSFFGLINPQNSQNINEFLAETTLDRQTNGYNCSKCDKNVTITKKESILNLPNTLIFGIDRIDFGRNKKDNSRFEFPRILNMKDFTTEECRRRDLKKEGKEMVEDAEVYFREDGYYEYFLVGVTVHVGSIQAGHYFSYINTVRGGKGNIADFDPENPVHTDSWLKFDDSRITKYDARNLEKDCFGGGSQSACILVYERKRKASVKLQCDEPDSSKEIIEIQNEDEIFKKYDWLRKMDEEERQKILSACKNTVFHSPKHKIYLYLGRYFDTETLVQKHFCDEIKADNASLNEDISIRSKKYAPFFNKIASQLVFTLKTMSSEENHTNIASVLLNFIFKEATNKELKGALDHAFKALIKLVKRSVEAGEFVVTYFLTYEELISETIELRNKLITTNILLLKREALLKMQADYEINPLEEPKHLTERKYVDILTGFIEKLEENQSLMAQTGVSLVSFIEKLYNIDTNHKLLLRKCLSTLILSLDMAYESNVSENESLTTNESLEIKLIIAEKENFLLRMMRDLNSLPKTEKGFTASEEKLNSNQQNSFMKAIFLTSKEAFSTILCQINRKSADLMEMTCNEMTTYVNQIDKRDEFDENLFTALEELLNIKDEHQLIRFEKLLGVPYFKIGSDYSDELPVCGDYENLVREEFFGFSSTVRKEESACFLEKMVGMRYEGAKKIKIWIAILTACASNNALLKYISFVPFVNKNSCNFISAILKDKVVKYNDEYKGSAASICSKLEERLKDTPSTVLPNFKGFVGTYCNNKVIAERYELIETKGNLSLIRIDYFCTITPNYWNTDYLKEVLYKGEKLIVPEDTVDIPIVDKPKAEFELIQIITGYDKTSTKVMFYDSKLRKEDCFQTVTKYRLYQEGSKSFDYEFQFKFEEREDANEYVPRGKISGQATEATDLAVISKINPTKDWITLNELTFEYSTAERDDSEKTP